MGGTCGNFGGSATCDGRGVPDPRGGEEMGNRGGRDNDASAGSDGGGSCLASSGVNPGSGGGSPRGGRGPGSPLASRPVRGQRLGSVEGWGGLRNHCEDVCPVSRVGGGDGGTCDVGDDRSVSDDVRVPDPRDEEERRTGTASNRASNSGNDDGHCLAYSYGDPGSGGGSPRGGRGPGPPLASRPVREQRLGSVGGWGGLGNHCEDVGRRGNGHDGLDGGLGDAVTHSVKGTMVDFSDLELCESFRSCPEG